MAKADGSQPIFRFDVPTPAKHIGFRKPFLEATLDNNEPRQTEQLLRGREAERRRALIASDREALSALLSKDLIHVHATGNVHGKSELLRHALEFLEFLDVQRGELAVRQMAPDIAVMTGAMTNTVRRRGAEEIVEVQAFVTQVWRKEESAWRIVNFHATRTDAEA